MLRARYPKRAGAPLSEPEIRSLCELALYQLVELLEEKRGRASAKVVRRILRGIGYGDAHIDRALAYHLNSKRLFVLGSNIHVAKGFG